MATYDRQFKIGSWNRIFETLIASKPLLLSRIRTNPQAIKGTSHTWFNKELANASSAVSSITDTTHYVMNSVAGFKVNDVVRITSSADVSRSEQLLITAIDTSTKTLTVSRQYGSTTAYTILVGDKFIKVSNVGQEGSSVTDEPKLSTGSNTNYVQLFVKYPKITGSEAVLENWDNNNKTPMAQEIADQMNLMAIEIENAIIHGVKVQRTGIDGSNNGSMGGILQFLQGGNVESTGGTLSATHLNNAFEMIFDDGGGSSNMAILCSANQAQRISALNTSGTNPIVQIQQTDLQTSGYAVSRFVGDIATANGSMSALVFTNPNMLKDQIAIIDLDKLSLRDYRPMTVEELAKNGDYQVSMLLRETTLEIDNPLKAHALITGLTV